MQAVDKGLLKTDDEYHRAMRDAAFQQRPSQLRLLFAHIILHCEVGSAIDLWTAFVGDLVEDFRRRMVQDEAESHALHHIQKVQRFTQKGEDQLGTSHTS